MEQRILHTTTLQPVAMLMLLVVMCMASCVWDKEELPEPITQGPEPITQEQCDTATYTFNNEIRTIFATSCAVASCHNNMTSLAGLNFTNYAGVMEKIDDGGIEAWMLNGNPSFMPPAGKLPDSTLAKISLWISEGTCE